MELLKVILFYSICCLPHKRLSTKNFSKKKKKKKKKEEDKCAFFLTECTNNNLFIICEDIC